MIFWFGNIKGSSSFLLPLILIVCTCLFVSSVCKPTFKTSPDYKVFTGLNSGSAIKISSDEKFVIIGYASGSVRIYDITGAYYYSCYGHSYKIIDVEYLSGYGWISLDSNGTAIRWGTTGTKMYTWYLNQTAIDMSVTNYNGNYWVAFNLGTIVL